MTRFNSIYELRSASDDEIKAFFSSASFIGKFSRNIPDELRDRFCGQITEISINGEVNALCPKWINVASKFEHSVKPGLVQFTPTVFLNLLRAEPCKYRLGIWRIKNIETQQKKGLLGKSTDKIIERFKTNLRLKNECFIGLFTENRDGSFTIRDIRRSDFSKLILQTGKEQSPIVYHPKRYKPVDGRYYEFTWILNRFNADEYKYDFIVDESHPLTPVTPPDLVRRLKEDILGYPAGASQKIVRMLETLKNQLTASGKEIFIYELLQNANDYPIERDGVKQKVDVEFHITDDSLIFMHSGAEFNEKNIAAICSINDKEKTENKDTIGYKGIGFKTVFLDNNFVYLQTGDYSFRFDEKESADIVDTPWQILPIWTKKRDLTRAELYVLENANEKFGVRFSLRPSSIDTLRLAKQNYERMFRNIFKNERVILFIPNLSSVKVYLKASRIPDITLNAINDKWQVNHFEEDVNPEITAAINSDLEKQEDTGALKIPTKYYDFKRTKISFACEIKDNNLSEVADSQIYCYLPTKASWGFKFLMNTDMIPTGPRDDLEIDFGNQINLNEEISDMAGSKFFDWIKGLCDTHNYGYSSIFNLVPDFETCIREHGKYRTLIEHFQHGFEERLIEPLIPSGPGIYSTISEVLFDETGLSSTGIMTDKEFMRFAVGFGDYELPVQELRADKDFHKFLRRYISECQIFDKVSLRNLIHELSFKEWLKEQENNNRFLLFLLEKDYLKDFLNEEIFLDDAGNLYCAQDLFYDIDTYLPKLKAFENLIYFLSTKTREFFKGNEKWEAITDSFKGFDFEDFVDNVLLSTDNRSSVLKKLEDKETSLSFFSLMASEDVSFDETYLSFPFINDEGEPVDEFRDKIIFRSSDVGHALCDKAWFPSGKVHFISPEYGNAVLDYLSKSDTFCLMIFSNAAALKIIILNEDNLDIINEVLEDDYAESEDFVRWCYSHEDEIKDGALKDFVLWTRGINNEYNQCLVEENIYLYSDLFEEYSSRQWLGEDWMYSLDTDYQNNISDSKEFENFLVRKFGVKILSAEAFYTQVVQPNIKSIIAKTSGNDDPDGSINIDFVKYLDDNYELIFDKYNGATELRDFKLVCYGCDTNLDLPNIYLYSDELSSIQQASWFNADLVKIAAEDYGDSQTLKRLGIKRYDFYEFFNSVIAQNIGAINRCINSMEESIALHSFMQEKIGVLNDQQKSVLQHFKMYLYGGKVSDKATGLKLLNPQANEAISMGFINPTDVDIIHPDYVNEDNRTYWTSVLGNNNFTYSDLINAIKADKQRFIGKISSPEDNRRFWRWIKTNIADKKQLLQELTSLPKLLLDNQTLSSTNKYIYFSDRYLGNKGIESFVKQFDDKAQFISADYVEDGESIDEWRNFWATIGVKRDIVDILKDAIDNRLSSIEVPNLVALIAENREELDNLYDHNLVNRLTELRVQGLDGEFYYLKDSLYIDCEKEEPFDFIMLPNQITFKTADERKLIRSILEKIGGTIIDTLIEWQNHKIDRYILLQNKGWDNVAEFHFDFIKELNSIRAIEHRFSKEAKQRLRLSEIKLLDANRELQNPTDLTLGSSYYPYFDFEKCGCHGFTYLNEGYSSQIADKVNILFREMGVHCDLRESDLGLLKNRPVSLYLWTEYLTSKRNGAPEIKLRKLEEFAKKGLLNNIECIPTEKSNKRPGELYYGYIVDVFLPYIEESQEKTPYSQIQRFVLSDGSEIFDILPFKKELGFQDALYALASCKSKEKRIQLLNWIVDSYTEEFHDIIISYREDDSSLWFNVKNEPVQIRSLYALERGNKMLEQYFGTNPLIINPNYLPVGAFREACDVLDIVTITSSQDDLEMVPGNAMPYSARNIALQLYALVFAGILNANKWAELYDEFKKKLSKLTLYKCDSIVIKYTKNPDIKQTLRKFYHQENTANFFFVDSLDHKRVFKEFSREFIVYLGIEEDAIAPDVSDEIMDSPASAIAYIKENNELMLDQAFKNEIELLIPNYSGQLRGHKAEIGEKDNKLVRPIWSASEYNAEQIDSETTEDVKAEEGAEHSVGKTETYKTKEHSDVDIRRTGGDASECDNHNVNTTPVIVNRPVPASLEKDRGADVEPSVIDNDGNEELTATRSQINHGKINSDGGHELRPSTYNLPQSKTPWVPTPEERERFGSHGIAHTLRTLDPMRSEIDEISRILGEDLSPDEVINQNYLAQLRLLKVLRDNNITPDETDSDFIRNASAIKHLCGKKYVHKCSAKGGIMYLSPSIWNKVTEDKCIVCVYYGAKQNEFKLFFSTDDILGWVNEDDIVIKLTGEEKAKVVQTLYSGVLNGVKGTAYTLIRIKSDEKYNSLFAELPDNRELDMEDL